MTAPFLVFAQMACIQSSPPAEHQAKVAFDQARPTSKDREEIASCLAGVRALLREDKWQEPERAEIEARQAMALGKDSYWSLVEGRARPV